MVFWRINLYDERDDAKMKGTFMKKRILIITEASKLINGVGKHGAEYYVQKPRCK